MSNNTISKEKITDYLDKTKQALDKLKIAAPERSHLQKIADDFLSMATSYYNDGQHFFKMGEYVDAFACVSYAHGWLDAGARLGMFDVEGDDTLFTLAE